MRRQLGRLFAGCPVLLILGLAAPVGAAGAHRETSAQPALQPPPTREERRGVRKVESRDQASLQAMQERLLLQPGAAVDVQRYTLVLRVTPATQRVDGSVRIQALVLAPSLAALDIGLYDNMAITSLTGGGKSLSYTRGGNLVHVSLDRVYGSGETVDLTVVYGGVPVVANFGGYAFQFATHGPTAAPIISSLSEDTFAPVWWPCIDRPDDKAIVDMDVTVPGSLVAVSNGLLTGTTLNGDGTKTYRWRSSYPISNYLVSLPISN